MPLPETMTIMIVEDDVGHARFIEIMLRTAGFDNEIIILHSGREAVDCLFEEGPCQGRPRPDPLVLLLDLNLPGVDGHEILEQIRATDSTANLPVVVVTSSLDPDEARRCMALGADAFIPKPPSAAMLRQTFERIGLMVE